MRNPVILLRHYVGLFGARGLVLYADRVARRFLPGPAYRLLPRLLWRAAGQNLKTARLGRTPVDTASTLSVIRTWSSQDRQWFEKRFPTVIEQKVAAAERIRRHEFDFLGTGPTQWGDPIGWHQDVKSGHRWPLQFYAEFRQDLAPGNGVDVKVPWELSRSHHLVNLAQAFWLTGDRRYSDELSAQWDSWVASNPWLYGVNWASAMEAAIRTVNLLWARALVSDGAGGSAERRAELEQSLRHHGAYIEHNLEFGVNDGHIVAANHYLANVCALACLGLSSPQLPEAERWGKFGLRALEQEMQRQVLPDGFFFESSTSYHRLAVELFLVPALLARRQGIEMSESYWRRLEQMMELVLFVTRPDGCVPQIGDNDDGRLLILSGYPDWARHDHRYLLALGAVLFGRGDFKAAADDCAEELYWLLGRDGVEAFDSLTPDPTPLGSRAFPEGGLYVMRSGDGRDYALVRAGSPAQAPMGHAHSDALSLELWVDGQPVFVDPGTYCYTSDLGARDRFRSTAAHNTVMIDGKEVGGNSLNEPFRREPGPDVHVFEWEPKGDEARLVAQYDDGGEVTYRRTVRYLAKSREWRIEDRLSGSSHGVWYWHLAPGRETPPATVTASFQVAQKSVVAEVSPRYGVSVPATVWELSGSWADEGSVRLVISRQMLGTQFSSLQKQVKTTAGIWKSQRS